MVAQGLLYLQQQGLLTLKVVSEQDALNQDLYSWCAFVSAGIVMPVCVFSARMCTLR